MTAVDRVEGIRALAFQASRFEEALSPRCLTVRYLGFSAETKVTQNQIMRATTAVDQAA